MNITNEFKFENGSPFKHHLLLNGTLRGCYVNNSILAQNTIKIGSNGMLPEKGKDEVFSKEIYSNCFRDNVGLKDIYFPLSTERICHMAFANSGLHILLIEPNIRYVGAYAFSGCKDLNNVLFKSNDIRIGDHVFEGCDNLEFVSIKGLKHLKQNVFKSCPKLKTIVFQDNLVSKIDENIILSKTAKIVANEDSYAYKFFKDLGYLVEIAKQA